MAETILKPNSEFAGILKESETYAAPDDASYGNQINSWFDRLMLQSGMEMAPGMVLALCLCAAIIVGGVVFVWQENLLVTAFAGFIGFLVPILVALVVRSRRQTQLSKQLPPMLEELAGAAKTGRSLENCLGQVANDTPNPLGAELRNCTRKLSLGLGIDEALNELPERTGLVATSVFATALSVHKQTGGDLVQVLERLSQTLRDRLMFQGRLKAATAASRATAILMIALPPAILAFFVFRDTNYLNNLFNSTWGARCTIFAFFLEFIGAIWVIRVFKTSSQG